MSVHFKVCQCLKSFLGGAQSMWACLSVSGVLVAVSVSGVCFSFSQCLIASHLRQSITSLSVLHCVSQLVLLCVVVWGSRQCVNVCVLVFAGLVWTGSPSVPCYSAEWRTVIPPLSLDLSLWCLGVLCLSVVRPVWLWCVWTGRRALRVVCPGCWLDALASGKGACATWWNGFGALWLWWGWCLKLFGERCFSDWIHFNTWCSFWGGHYF